MLCLMAFTMNAQRCAVLEFKAGVGISQADVDGISAIFITYFRPAGYTMVERTQIDKAIEEQGFQRSKMTESQMVRIGQILNVSKIVVGDVNIVMGQYNVDARVINVETGTIAATEGATFAGSSYRTTMQSIATKLAGKIAITPGATVSATPTPPTPPASTSPKQRTKVEILYGYLKIFPNELGTFQAEPTTVISQINAQAQHGYNNWRIPTNEELSLMRANNYLGYGEYMTKESKHGIVLLVSDGKDYATLQAEERERERQRVEQEKAESERQKIAALKAQGWIDLGLPSGTMWKDWNESGFYDYDAAVRSFGSKLPTKEQLEELKNSCQWTWTGNGYKVTGPNGNFIVLPAAGNRDCGGNVGVGSYGGYWSSTPIGSDDAWFLLFDSSGVDVYRHYRCDGQSVRLVQD
ncbi:MAG: hypothetical protein IKO34_02530 [Bacteroidales bacterium]|nr:hypothetical protein [Bacteroidales bacterium]